MNRLAIRFLGALLLLALSMSVAWSAEADKIKVKSADGQVVVVFKRAGEQVKIEDGNGRLLFKGKPREEGGRKYKAPDGAAQIKATESDQGFKLKGERGDLHWKVKRRDGRITIADNDAESMADELRHTKKEKWAVEWDGKPQGKVKYYPDKAKIKVKDASGRELYQVKEQPLSPLYAVLLITRIPRDDAYIIMAEMWLRGW